MTDPVETAAAALLGEDLCPPLTCRHCNKARREARALIAQIGPALVAEAVAQEREAASKDLRQALAAMVLAYGEPDRDELSDEEADKITARWFAHWMRLNSPSAHEHDDHSGDCTKQSWPCLRCLADRVFATVDAAIRARGRA